MAYADLTQQQKTELQEWLQFARPIFGELARTLNHLDAAKTAHSSHVAAILAELSAPDEIPNESGLAGAVSLAKSELTAILVQADSLLMGYGTAVNRELWTKFCGAENMIG